MKQVHDAAAGLRIQSPGGFIRKKDRRRIGHGTGDGHTLFLSAGQFLRTVLHPFLHSNPFQQPLCTLRALPFRHTGIHHGNFHIAHRRSPRNEVVCLKHETDLLIADPGAFIVRCLTDILPVQKIGTRIRPVQQTDDIHQRTLSGTGFPHDGNELSFLDVQTYAMEHLQFVFFSFVIFFYNVFKSDQTHDQ